MEAMVRTLEANEKKLKGKITGLKDKFSRDEGGKAAEK